MTIACRATSEPAGAPDGGALAASEERVVDPLVGLGLLGGLDRTSLQVFHGEWLAGHKGLPSLGMRSNELGGLVSLKGMDELHGWRGLNGKHGS